MISYKAAVASTPGGKNNHNGDNFYFNTRYLTEDLAESQVLLSHKKNQRGLQIYAVCDGSNADSQSEEASLILAKNLIKYHKKLVDNPSSDVPKTISEYIDVTNEQVNKQIRQLMGKRIYSTLALLCVERESTLICSVGDSRVYSYSKGRLTQITEDHTQAQRMVQLGLLTPERALTHVKREKLTQYFGEMPAGMSIDPFMETTLSKHGDTYILCTRGFYEAVPPEQMEKVLAKQMSPADTVDEMMAYAMDAGIKDDATVIVVTAYDSSKTAAPVIASAGTAAAADSTADSESPSTLFAHDEANTPSTDSKQQFEEYNENYDEPAEDVDSFIGKLLSPFRRGGKKNLNEFWPALIIFSICILAVVVLSVFGYNLFLRNRDNELEPTKLPSSTVEASATPGSSGNIKTAGPGDSGFIDPDATPSGGGNSNDETQEPTDRPTQEPTEEPEDPATAKPTQEPTNKPTQEPAVSPTQVPTPSPSPTQTPTQAPEPSPTEEGTPTPPSTEPAPEEETA